MKAQIISKNAQSDLQKRAVGELYAENFYRILANNMQFIGYFGAQEFFLREAKSESEHYQRLVDFLNDVGVLVEVTIFMPFAKKITSLNDAFQAAYDTERELQIVYENLLQKYSNESTVNQFLLWYVDEQRKSVGEIGDILSRIELTKNDPAALLRIDHELKKQ